MINDDAFVIVTITFHRIQSFIFAVPRLKAMIGANVLLGETIRQSLVQILDKINWIPDNTVAADITFDVTNDPLRDIELNGRPEYLKDNPQELLKNRGVISRDGGHFTAVFEDRASAEAFIRKAKAEISQNLPGVQFEVDIKPEYKLDHSVYWGDSPIRLPQLQVCQDIGTELVNIQEKNGQREPISTRVEQLGKKAEDFKTGTTSDIIGLLREKLPRLDSDIRIPSDLKTLAGNSGYIAVIHADGNSMGERQKLWANNAKHDNKARNFKTYIDHEIKNEQFFHAMRVAVRASVINALKETFTKEALSEFETLPYHLLMLGGDDLLLITQPQFAFPFVINYSKELKGHKIPYKTKESKPISMGAGIVIASHNVPMFHLYSLAEELASSAKTLFRSQEGNADGLPKERSVVDWALATTSWINGVVETRKQEEYFQSGTKEVCTMARPYFVLNDEGDSEDNFTLEKLWKEAVDVKKKFEESTQSNGPEQLARSQLKRLLSTITTGKINESEEQYQQLPEAIREQLQNLFGKTGEMFWHQETPKRYLTQYKDFIELLELHYLGRQKNR